MTTTAPAQRPATAGATAQPARRRPGTNPILRVMRLHFADRMQMIATPAIILASMVLLGVIIYVVVLNLTPVTQAQLTEGFSYNQAALWSWPGLIVTIGVYAYARTMPYAIGMMGSTRRHYWLGTALWIVVQSAYLSALIGAFLVVEQLTGHWFTGARMFDVVVFGEGNLGIALMLSFAIALACLAVGTTLAAVYLRFGQTGVLLGVAGLLAVIVGALALVLATGIDLITFFSTDIFVKVSGLFVLVAVVASIVSWFVVRRVPVGR